MEASGTPGPSPPGRDVQATNGWSSAVRVKPGAVSATFSCGETASGAPNAPPAGRIAATAWPSMSEPGSIEVQLTIVALPLPAAATAVTGCAAGESGWAAPKRP